MEIPKDIAQYLTRDEKIKRVFELKNCRVFASNNRLYVKEGRRVRDATYEHISSIQFKSKRYFSLIGIGIFLMLLAFIPSSASVLFFLIAIILIVLGIFLKREWLDATVIGLQEPLKFEGSRSNLDSLFKIIREKQETAQVTAPPTISKKYCPYCGAENLPLTVFCQVCGKYAEKWSTEPIAKPQKVSKTKVDVIEQIEKLAELKNKGIITQEEFENKKKELLSRI
jgi:uncharacterized Zn finger protein (UPF0148 family)